MPIISRQLMAEQYRMLSHGMTQDALAKLVTGEQRTVTVRKLSCGCDACSELIARLAAEKRIRNT